MPTSVQHTILNQKQQPEQHWSAITKKKTKHQRQSRHNQEYHWQAMANDTFCI